jgi:uncharacterized RDD family membrane protein YckC
MELRPAGLWRRAAARFLDGLVGLVAWSLGATWLVIVAWASRRSALELREAALLGLAIVTLGMALHDAYQVVFVGGCGQTPGRMVLGIAVVRRDGGRAGYGRAGVRCLAGMLSFLTLGLASLGVLFTRERRGLADWMAGTRVVRV